jgi:dienelactone hydrolase
MLHIIVSDIFGRTKALEKLGSAISKNVEILDPYSSEMMEFSNEADAYKYFTSEVGLDKYAESLSKTIKSVSKQVTLIGFSVGASAVWKISMQRELANISSATCFYGSQIRNYRDINPLFPIQLIFPATETHFSVSELITDLSAIENVKIQQVAYFHGFMNTHSQNYDQSGYNHFTQAMCNAPFDK